MRFPATPANDEVKIMHYDIKAAEAWELGAAVYLDATPELVECGADPTEIRGFSQAKVASGDLYGEMAGLGLKCPVALAEVNAWFWMAGDNDPVATDVDKQYGLAVDGDGIWYVDGTDTTNKCVYVHNVDLTRNLYLVEVLASVQQNPAASS